MTSKITYRDSGRDYQIDGDTILSLITENGEKFDLLITGESIQIFYISADMGSMRIKPRGTCSISVTYEKGL